MKKFWRDFWIGFTIVFVLTIFAGKLLGNLSMDNVISLIGVMVSAAAIVFISWNTNRQIKNQNKESQRPYITVLDAKKEIDNFIGDEATIQQRLDNSDFHHGHIVITANSTKNKEEVGFHYLRKIVKFELHVKNIGYGIACNMDFIPANDTAMYSHCRSGQKSGDIFSTVDIETEGTRNLDFNMHLDFETDKNGKVVAFATDAAHLLIFYTDLHGNVYSTMLILVVNKGGILSYTCYPESTESFKSMMKTINGDYKKSIGKYTEKHKR